VARSIQSFAVDCRATKATKERLGATHRPLPQVLPALELDLEPELADDRAGARDVVETPFSRRPRSPRPLPLGIGL
jgi:hypothetical protein